jgi:hypothetical protein
MDYESYFSGRLEQLLGEARVDNRKISKMRQNHAKTLGCKRSSAGGPLDPITVDPERGKNAQRYFGSRHAIRFGWIRSDR